MNMRDLLSKLDYITEAVTIDDINAALVGKESDEQGRARILQAMAEKEGLPGLYDPVSGYFVSAMLDRNGETGQATPRISATGSEKINAQLAALGLMPKTAKQSALGGLIGTGSLFGSSAENDKARQANVTTSDRAIATQHSDKLNATNLAKLKELTAKLKGTKPAGPGEDPTKADAVNGMDKASDIAAAAKPAEPDTGGAGKPSGLTGIVGLQTALKNAGADLGPTGVDGKMGKFTRAAMAKFPEVAAKFQAGSSVKPTVKENKVSIKNSLMESFGYQLNEFGADDAAIAGGTYALANPLEKHIEKKAAQKLATTAGADALKAGAKGFLGKAASKILPGVGTVFGVADAYNRAKEGDMVGAGIAGASAALSLIPGFGWIPAAGLDALNFARDMSKGSADSKTAQEHPVTDGPVAQLQKAIGTTPDGVWGPKSSTALKAFQQAHGLQADGIPGPKSFGAAGIKLPQAESKSVAQEIKETRERLERLHNPEPLYFFLENGQECMVTPDDNVVIFEAGYVAQGLEKAGELGSTIFKAAKDNPNAIYKELPGAKQVAKDLTGGSGITGAGEVGMKRAQAAADQALERGRAGSKELQGTLDDMIRGNKVSPEIAQQIENTPGGVVAWAKANPKMAKTLGLVGSVGAGTAIGLSTGAGGGAHPTTTPTTGGGAHTTTTPTPTPNVAPEAPSGPSPEQLELIKQLQAQMATLADVEDPAIQAALGDAQGAIDAVSKPTATPKATNEDAELARWRKIAGLK